MAAQHPQSSRIGGMTAKDDDDIEGLMFVVSLYCSHRISPFRSFLIRMVAGVGKTRLIVALILIALALIILALAVAATQPTISIVLGILAGGCLVLALFLT
jgi:hypothetical protein